MNLDQGTADYLIGCRKIYAHPDCVIKIATGDSKEIDFYAQDNRKEAFRVLVNGHSRNPKKLTIQLMARHSVVLLRLDTVGVHQNPDGEIVKGLHLHVYRQHHDARFASSNPREFQSKPDPLALIVPFLEYCNCIQVPKFFFQGGMFA